MYRIKITKFFLISHILLFLIILCVNILLIYWQVLPKVVTNNINLHKEKIDFLLLDQFNDLINIIEYTELLSKNMPTLSNTYLDNLRFKSNIFSRYYNLWDALLIINETNDINHKFQINNLIVYNYHIMNFLKENDLSNTFQTYSDHHNDNSYRLESININNYRYMELIYKTNIDNKNTFILIILNSNILEKYLQNFIKDKSYLEIKIPKAHDIFISDNGYKNLFSKHYKRNLSYQIYQYPYFIPKTNSKFVIEIKFNLWPFVKTKFPIVLTIFSINLFIYIFFLFSIYYLLRLLIVQNQGLFQSVSKLNTQIFIIDEIYYIYNIFAELKNKYLRLKECHNKLENKNDLIIAINNNLKSSLENLLNNYESMRNSIVKNSVEKQFYIDCYEYYINSQQEYQSRQFHLIEFLEIICHEIKTPLYSIIGFLEIIGNNNFPEKKINEYMMHIGECSQYILSLIKELVHMSKISNNTIIIKKTSIDLKDCIKQALRYISERAHAKKITFNLSIDDHFEKIFFDLECLNKIIINILINSVHYSPMNTKVNITINKNDNDLSIIVQDNGSGFDTKTLDLITKKYYTKSKNQQGFGLGMFLVDKLVKINDGEMFIKSEVNVGTTISLLFHNAFNI